MKVCFQNSTGETKHWKANSARWYIKHKKNMQIWPKKFAAHGLDIHVYNKKELLP